MATPSRTLRLCFFALAACTDPRLGEFSLPRRADDVRGRLLPYVEGHQIGEARDFLARHGFRCEPPLPSAAEAHVQLCLPPLDAGRAFTLELYERRGRVADVQAR